MILLLSKQRQEGNHYIMMVGGFSHREMSFNILQLFNVLFVLSFLLEAACGFRVERCSPAGDIIEKSASLTIGRHRISIRECDQVAGDGNAHWFNRTHCRCSYGQSFVVDPNENIPEPKCMQKYGQDKDDLKCGYRFKDEPNIKALNPRTVTQTIGPVSYGRTRMQRCSIIQASMWNADWQSLPDLLKVENGNVLVWKSSTPRLVAEQFNGVLFNLKLKCYRGRRSRTSCLLLKIIGTRSYPFQILDASSSTVAVSPSMIVSLAVHTSKLNPRKATSILLLTGTTMATLAQTSNAQHLATSSVESTSSTSSSKKYSSPKNSIPRLVSTVQPASVKLSSSVKISATQSKPQAATIVTPHSTSTSMDAFKTKSTISSKYVSLPTSRAKYSENDDGRTVKQKQNATEVGLIAGIVAASLLTVITLILLFYLHQKRNRSKFDDKNRRETLALDLTTNTFMNEYDNERDGESNKDIGNAIYGEKIKFDDRVQKVPISNDGIYEYAYTSKGSRNDDEPVYKEVVEEGPIYAETDDVYQPIEGNAVSNIDDSYYQPLDASTLSRGKMPYGAESNRPVVSKSSNESATTDAPIYQVLDKEIEEKGEQLQSPVYQTVESEATYRELEGGKVDIDANVYTGLNALQREPFYQELDPNQYGIINHDFASEQV